MAEAVKPKALLFDLDGTLIDTAPDFSPTVNQLRAEHGLEDLPDDVIREQVSNGGRALTRLALNMPEDHPEFSNKRQRLLDIYCDHIASASDLFPGMEETLRFCDQNAILWGIVTNKPRLYTDLLMTRLEKRIPILKNCSVVICPDDVERTKPWPDPLFLAAEKINTNAADCWYVGDHIRDIEAGHAADMTTIAVSYGYIEENDNPESWNAGHIVSRADQIISLIPDS